MLRGKRILLGVTGSIAAYKAALVVRELVKQGAEVRVVMTQAATDFITPLTLSTLSKNPVHYRYTDDAKAGTWNNHVELGLWADLFIIAPATANTLAKMARGICDNLLMATYLSAKCPVMFAPAMDRDMFLHPSTEAILSNLASFGNIMIPPGEGELASGLEGRGRMAEAEQIREAVVAYFAKGRPLHGKRVLISAGPTHEAIDPVRYIGNRSSGKMGFALAREASRLGAETVLVAGPVHQESPEGVKRLDVTSAAEMHEVITAEAKSANIVIMAAAVADYKAKEVQEHKIKKSGTDGMSIELERTQDIIAALGEDSREDRFLVGFALESRDAMRYGAEKLRKKNLDMIVVNSLADDGAGFAHDTNQVTVIHRDGEQVPFTLKTKDAVAADIFEQILSRC